ncbi:hypothetical protein [Luteolibacter sp. Populi]|uniref:hypothetical protein n=1 Tax=Luteolibacter sp. Populi TaxID=3230487 RepID=UPI003465D367
MSKSPFAIHALTKAIAAFGFIGLASPASATLLLDYTGGTVLGSASVGPSDKDDGFATSGESFDAPFFGESLSDPFPRISFNGHIYFGSGDGSGDYAPTAFGTSPIIRISPMWTDLSLGAASQVIQNTGSGSSYNAVTWVNMQGGLGNEGFVATFQAIYFNAAATLNGISFNAGDIAFSYGDIENFNLPADIMIGLDKGTGGFATLPGYETTEGWASHAGYGDLPVGADEYVHFRPDGGGYDVTIEPIPEPSAIAVALLGSLLLIARRRR